MSSARWLSFRVLALLLAASPLSNAQSPVDDLAARAALIFRGTVVAIEPGPAAPDALPMVHIHFRVSEAFRGIDPGQELTITEWQGLWTTGDRYRIGEDALLFLYPATDSGLTSPVAGPPGHVIISATSQRPDRSPRPASSDTVATSSREPAPADSKGSPTRRRVGQP